MHDTFTLHDVFLATGPKDILSLAHDSVPFYTLQRNTHTFIILFYFTVLRRHSLVLAFVSTLIGAI